MSKPTHTAIAPRATADEVASAFPGAVKGRVVVITGANTGLGFETARVLAKHGAKVVVTCRSKSNVDKTIERLKQELKTSSSSGSDAAEPDILGIELELGSLTSVRKAAQQFLDLNLPLHVLINNAGIMAGPHKLTEDGFEAQFGVNHLGHFLFTNLLLEKIKESAPSRIINVSSVGHWAFGPRQGFYWDDLDGKKSYERFPRYGQSKLANVLFSLELQRRLDESGATNVTAVSLHPGNITSTDLMRQPGVSWAVLASFFTGLQVVLRDPPKTIPQGASTQVFCAVSPDIVKGEYYVDNGVEHGGRRHSLARDVETAKKLWEVSVELIEKAKAATASSSQ